MINVSPLTKIRALYHDHIEHYSGNGNIIAVRPNGGLFNLTVKIGDEPTVEFNNRYENEAIAMIKSILMVGDLYEGAMFDMMINQGFRFCDVVKVTPTRVRLEYEMPNAGLMGGWYKTAEIGGKKFLKLWI